MWNFIVSIPDLCLLFYFVEIKTFSFGAQKNRFIEIVL